MDGSLISNATVVADFFTYESSQRGGVYVAGGNIIGTSNADLVVGAGPGGGPRVRIFDGAAITEQRTSFTGNQPGDVSADFFAYESTFRDGVLVAVSPNLGGTSADEITVAPGDGGAPRIRVLNGTQIRLEGQNYTSMNTGDALADFISGNSDSRGGAFVATADFNRDGIPDITVGTGVNATGTVTVYSGSAIQTQGTSFTGTQTGDVLNSFSVDGSGYTNGVSVGAAIETAGTANGLLFYGYGGAGVDGQAVLSKYEVVSGGVSRQVVNTLSLDGADRGIFVSE